MKIRFCYFVFLLCLVLGCGRDTNSPSTNEQVALNIIHKYDFQTEGDPKTENFTLPQELDDANWGLKEIICEQAGFNFKSYAGEVITSMRYSILEKCNGEPLYLWILIKENTCICAYITVRENSGLIPGVFAVNDACIQ